MSNICNILNISCKAPLGIAGNGAIKIKYYSYYLTIRRGLMQYTLSVYGVLSYALIRSHNPMYWVTGVVALTCFLFHA